VTSQKYTYSEFYFDTMETLNMKFYKSYQGKLFKCLINILSNIDCDNILLKRWQWKVVSQGIYLDRQDILNLFLLDTFIYQKINFNGIWNTELKVYM